MKIKIVDINGDFPLLVESHGEWQFSTKRGGHKPVPITKLVSDYMDGVRYLEQYTKSFQRHLDGLKDLLGREGVFLNIEDNEVKI